MQSGFHPGQCEKRDEKQQEEYLEGLRLQAEEWGGGAVGPREPWEMVDPEKTTQCASLGAAVGLRIPPQPRLHE